MKNKKEINIVAWIVGVGLILYLLGVQFYKINNRLDKLEKDNQALMEQYIFIYDYLWED